MCPHKINVFAMINPVISNAVNISGPAVAPLCIQIYRDLPSARECSGNKPIKGIADVA